MLFGVVYIIGCILTFLIGTVMSIQDIKNNKQHIDDVFDFDEILTGILISLSWPFFLLIGLSSGVIWLIVKPLQFFSKSIVKVDP